MNEKRSVDETAEARRRADQRRLDERIAELVAEEEADALAQGLTVTDWPERIRRIGERVTEEGLVTPTLVHGRVEHVQSRYINDRGLRINEQLVLVLNQDARVRLRLETKLLDGSTDVKNETTTLGRCYESPERLIPPAIAQAMHEVKGAQAIVLKGQRVVEGLNRLQQQAFAKEIPDWIEEEDDGTLRLAL